MKKLIDVLLICLIISLLFTACSPQESGGSLSSENLSSEISEVSENSSDVSKKFEPVEVKPLDIELLRQYSKAYSCFYFPETPFGINEEQLYEALGKTASDFERVETEGKRHPDYKLVTKGEFLGKEVYYVYEFINIPNTDFMPLQLITIAYPMEGKTLEELKPEIEALLEPRKDYFTVSGIKERIDVNDKVFGKSFAVNSNDTTVDLPQNIKDGYNHYIYHLYNIDYYRAIDAQNKERRLKLDYSIQYEKELSRVIVSHYYDMDVCHIIFDNGGFMQPILYGEAYSELY